MVFPFRYVEEEVRSSETTAKGTSLSGGLGACSYKMHIFRASEMPFLKVN